MHRRHGQHFGRPLLGSSNFRCSCSPGGCLAPPAVAADLPQSRPQTGLTLRPRLFPLVEAGDRASRTACLARVLGRGAQPATPAHEGTIELQQLVKRRTGLPSYRTAGCASQGNGPGAVSGPPAASNADPFPSKATVDGLARAWCRPGRRHHKLVQPLDRWPRILGGTPDRCQGRPFARLHLQ